MTPTKKNEKIGVPCADAPNNPTKPAPTADEHLATAIAVKRAAQAKNPEPASVARERLLSAKNEAFPRSTQYRPVQDESRNVGSGEG